MAEVVLQGVSKRYGDVLAVDNVSLTVRNGEFVSLLGPSGSGKTTLLRLIAGFIEPTTGLIMIDGVIVNGVPIHQRNIGMVFQSYALFPHLNVFENVAFGLRMRRVPDPEIRRRVGEALAMVRLSALEHRLPRELSGGQQQRVALARAIVIRPSLLLLDEPLSALDKKLRAEMQIEVRQLQRQLGITTIYVTHDQEEALTMSDRIAVMHDRVIQQYGTPRDIYERPANAFVMGFIGAANLFDAVVERVEGGQILVNVAGLRLIAAGEGKLGQHLKVAFRPERVQISRTAAEGPNWFAGHIVNAVYLGDTTRYYIHLDGGLDVIATVQNGRQTAAGEQFRPGDVVSVGCAPEDIAVLTA